MTDARINRIIASLKDHSYQPNPAWRTYIAKQNDPTRTRPLGLPSTDDKLVQEIVRMILEAIYEPIPDKLEKKNLYTDGKCDTINRYITLFEELKTFRVYPLH